MTTDSKKCHTQASLANKSSGSLIIQLPSTSANRVVESDSNGCRQEQANARLLGAHRLARPNPSPANTANLTPNHQHHRNQQQQQQQQHHHNQNHQHHRISQHRYEQNIAHSAIDHHLVQTHDSTAIPGAGSSSLDSDHSSASATPPPNYHEIPGIVPSYHGRSSGPPPAYDDVVNPNAPPPSYQSLFGQVREARKRSNGLVDLLRQLFLVLIGTLGCTMIIGFLLLIPITMIFIGFFYMNECRAENIPSFLVIGGFVWIMKNVLNCYNQFKKDSTTINRPPPPRRRPISAGNAATTSAPSAIGAPSSSQRTGNSAPIDSSQSSNAQMNITVSIATSTSTAIGQSAASSTTTATATTTATTTTRSQQTPQHIRHPPMIGITSYKCESILNYFLIVWFLAGCIVVYRIYEPDYENPLSSTYCNRTVYLYAFWLMTSAFIIMAIILSCLCCLMASSLISCSQSR